MTERKLPAWCRPDPEPGEKPAKSAKRKSYTREELKRIQRKLMRESGGYSGEVPRSTWELF
jgi:hypothetical protein